MEEPAVYQTDEGRLQTAPTLKPLAIVGSHPDRRELIPFDDPDVEIWVFNETPQKDWCRRWDVCFQLHGPQVYTSPDNYVHKDHWDWMQKAHGKPIFMQAVDERVPDSVAYPLEGVLSLVPYRYLRSSVAEALALAIYLGYKDISLYGSELTSNTEYGYQATNMAFWIGFAHGRGINLQLRCWESEFFQPLYGFEGELRLEQPYFINRALELEAEWKVLNKALRKIKSNLDEAMLKASFDLVASLSVDYEGEAMAAGEAAGALGEAERYAERTTPIPRQEYEFSAAKAQREGELIRAKMYHAGGKAEYVWNYWRQTGNGEALTQLRMFLKEKGDHAYDTGARMGIYRENLRNMQEYDQRVTAAGGVRSLAAVGLVEMPERKEA